MPNLGTIIPDLIESLEESARKLKKLHLSTPIPLGGIKYLKDLTAQITQQVDSLLATMPNDDDQDHDHNRDDDESD
jgi:ABC-type phosphate/phosphonate transport system substrate-binding protein